MSTTALNQGMALLLLTWPHRAKDEETILALTHLYGDALADLSDDAFLGGCKAAVKTCKHFPVPVELLNLAETHAEQVMNERMATIERQRIQLAVGQMQKMLASGQITEDQAAANRDALSQKLAERDSHWPHEQRAATVRRLSAVTWEPDDDSA